MDLVRLKKLGFTHILNAAEGRKFGQINTSATYYEEAGIRYLGFSIIDHPSYQIGAHFEEAIRFLSDALSNKKRTSFTCWTDGSALLSSLFRSRLRPLSAGKLRRKLNGNKHDRHSFSPIRESVDQRRSSSRIFFTRMNTCPYSTRFNSWRVDAAFGPMKDFADIWFSGRKASDWAAMLRVTRLHRNPPTSSLRWRMTCHTVQSMSHLRPLDPLFEWPFCPIFHPNKWNEPCLPERNSSTEDKRVNIPGVQTRLNH